MARPIDEDAQMDDSTMPQFQGEVIRDSTGREMVCFTTPAGVRVMMATSISPEALDKMARGLRQRIATSERRRRRVGDGRPQSR